MKLLTNIIPTEETIQEIDQIIRDYANEDKTIKSKTTAVLGNNGIENAVATTIISGFFFYS